jgi:4-hydroxymandelate oxidase
MDLETLEREAAAIVEPSAWSYIERGSGGADTRAANLAAWRRLRLRPHVLRDVTNVTTQTTVLGIPVSAPVLVAPTAMQQLAHPDGERATARGAAACAKSSTPSPVSSAGRWRSAASPRRARSPATSW